MNTRIHNPKLANLQISAGVFENNIIEGQRQVEDLNDFNNIYQELKDLINSYKSLYLETKEEMVKEEYDSFLAQEIDFLNLMKEIMKILDSYHDVVGFVEGREIKQEIEKASIIINYRNIERKIAILKRMGSMPDSYQEQYKNLINQYQDLRNEVIEAESYILEKSRTGYNTMEISDGTEKKKSLYALDYDFYNTLHLVTDKINYIKLIISNIEKVKGKKSFVTYCGVTKEISTKYASKYREYMCLLNNLYKEYELAEREMIKEENSKSNTDLCANQYASVIIALYKLSLEALPVIEDKEQVITVKNINGENLTILKTRQEKFNELIGKYEDLKKMTPYLNENSGLMLVQNIAEYKKLMPKRENIFNTICFWQNKTEKNELTDKKIKELKSQLYNLHMANQFVLITNMKAVFKISGLPEQVSVFYTNIVQNVDGFIASRKYTGEEKYQVLTDIVSKIEDFNDKKGRINVALPLLIEENFDYLSRIILRVKQAFGYLSERNRKQIGIVTSRKSSDLLKMKKSITNKSGYIAASLGMTVFVGITSFVSSYEVNKNVNLESKKVVKTEDKVENIIEKIYKRVEESRESNKVLIYDYNGMTFELDPNSKGFKEKKQALEEHGAVLLNGGKSL